MTFKSMALIMLSVVACEVIKFVWNKTFGKDEQTAVVLKFCESSNAHAPIVTEVVSDKVTPINSALFFPVSEDPCRFFYKFGNCHLSNCQFSHNAKVLSCLFQYLNMAKKSIDICVYMITSFELCNEILNISKRGVKVRIITDGTFGDEDRTRIKKFRSEGISVRSNLPADRLLMHHKFTLVDSTLLINGSFNWTWQAITGNHENLMITNQADLVLCYVQEFNRLWEEFLPSQQTATLNFNQY